MANKQVTEKKGLKRLKGVKHDEKIDQDKIDQYLESKYYDISKPGSYMGANTFWISIKKDKQLPEGTNLSVVKAWLDKQETFNLHRQPKRNFKTEQIIVGQVNQQWDGDLLVLTNYAKFNKGYGYIMVLIDLFSRFVFLEPLKTKGTKDVVAALKDVFEGGRIPQVLRSDQGKEWLGKGVKDYLESKKVKQYIAYGAYHASYAERCIRVVKKKLFRHFSRNKTYEWVSILDQLADSLNATVHSVLKMAPKEVSVKNEQEIYERVYLPIELKREKTEITYAFRVGDKVRISHDRGQFHKSYKETFTQELFVIAARLPTHPVRYRLKDLAGDLILGSFYESELQLAQVSDDTLYAIEKVIRYKVINKQKMALVKWLHYDSKFNSYIPASDIVKYK